MPIISLEDQNGNCGSVRGWKKIFVVSYQREVIGMKRRKKDEKKLPQGVYTDPMGSYTGRPLDEGEKPVQDADDL